MLITDTLFSLELVEIELLTDDGMDIDFPVDARACCVTLRKVTGTIAVVSSVAGSTVGGGATSVCYYGEEMVWWMSV